ncbi:unnamed protein product [Haemonchus placei]|uniref:Uncharacterized protein n=1 Tax=Haemonchus placei TaxID=6290 RepID=A0A0N4WME2_HAEPC|nr:unnamed protein product [Haemonchus placei]
MTESAIGMSQFGAGKPGGWTRPGTGGEKIPLCSKIFVPGLFSCLLSSPWP